MTRASANVSEDEVTTGFGDGAGASDVLWPGWPASGVGVTACSVGDSTKQASTKAARNSRSGFLSGIIQDQISLPVLRLKHYFLGMTERRSEGSEETRSVPRWRYLIDVVVLAVVTFLLDAVLSAFIRVSITAEPIKIAAVLPFSDGVEAYEGQARLGLDLAAKEINASGGILVIESPTGLVTIGKNHHATLNMFLAKTEDCNLVTVHALGEIGPEPGGNPAATARNNLTYKCSEPPLEITFPIEGGHYSGVVQCGNLFLEKDIPTAPVVRCKLAEAGKFYTLVMMDFDGNANRSWPDPVPPGKNAPVRHWIVGNIPGELLRTTGYHESAGDTGTDKPRIIQAYRAPDIPVVSDRYGLYLFEQAGRAEFAERSGPITNFDYAAFLKANQLREPIAANFFVAVYTSASSFSGKPFQGNDVSAIWQKDRGNGQLASADAPSPKTK